MVNKDHGQLLTLLATGLTQLHDLTLRGEAVTSPYPLPLQQGMHRLAAFQLDAGKKPISGLQDLLRLIELPIGDWGLNLSEEVAAANERLWQQHMPTQFCFEWAHEQGVDAFEEERLLREVIDTCRQADRPDSYSAFRELLIRKPVLTTLELQQAKLTQALSPIRNQLTEAYVSAPESASRETFFSCCKHCGSLLLRIDGDQFECENERCRSNSPSVGRTISEGEGVLWLTSGLRRYVMRPGLIEIKLQEQLETLGLSVDMWPNYDAYDLRVQVGNEFWAVDVKDWSNPFRLAASARSIRRDPIWDRAFYVFPDDRLKQRSDYLSAFLNRWDAPPTTEALMMKDFVERVKRAIVGRK